MELRHHINSSQRIATILWWEVASYGLRHECNNKCRTIIEFCQSQKILLCILLVRIGKRFDSFVELSFVLRLPTSTASEPNYKITKCVIEQSTMKNRNTDLVAMRSSFSMRSPATSVDGSCPPSKIRRTSPRPVNSSDKVATGCSTLHCGVDFLTNTYGFSPNEFLPIVGRKYRVPEALDSRVSDVLCDDALGRCLFSGFLNSFETAQLSSISKRFRKIASHQVNRLDLSRCPHLKVEDLTMIVRRFPNLKVRIISVSIGSKWSFVSHSFFGQDLNFDYCKQFGISHLQALLPISAKLESLSLKGCNLNDSHLCAFLETIASQNRGSTRLKLLDLSAIDEEGSLRIGNATLEAISVSL